MTDLERVPRPEWTLDEPQCEAAITVTQLGQLRCQSVTPHQHDEWHVTDGQSGDLQWSIHWHNAQHETKFDAQD